MKPRVSYFLSETQKKWAAATGESPYFCFVADTEEAAFAKAKAALAFYCSVYERAQEFKRERESDTEGFRVDHTVSAKQLAHA
jgi:hypothetical protein